ncbi:hypothetical protein OAQ61_00320 [Candidatus Marinimicrobia bacterium]|nr:hypothetical protein [Candidatus Neomarinimicrobiota bacterium]
MSSPFTDSYKDFITLFINQGYKTIFFDELDINKNNQLILRHDIDFDLNAAYDIALIEKKLGVFSTYFFLLRGEFYNLLSDENCHKLKKIQDLGHKVSLHFDIEIYQNPKSSLEKEIKIFQGIFDTSIDIISIHRPNQNFLSKPNRYFHIMNTYENSFFEQTKYFADSGGRFRYGNPIKSEEFISNKNIQLLTHPIWWVSSHSSVKKILNKLTLDRTENLNQLLKKNVKTFK